MPKSWRVLPALLLSTLLTSPALFAFNSPLSDEAIREAYFLGQRRDEKMTAFLEKYKQHLREPDRGPFVSSVEFLTPFALADLQSKDRSARYNAHSVGNTTEENR